MADNDPDRRSFLKVATCAVGGGLGLVGSIPALRLLADPAGRTTVTTPREPLDLGPVDRFRIGGAPRRVDVVAPVLQDGWTSARDVVLGAAWIRRVDASRVEALSAVCPHLGCAITWVGAPGVAGASRTEPAGHFLCPCHDSRFSITGQRQTGPAERDLDPLPVEIRNGRLALTWVRYKLGSSSREPA